MSRLPIIIAPDPRLKIVCRPVERVDAEVRRLMDDLLETMHAAPGIGLSAPQVGDDRRILVVDLSRKDEEPQPHQMANPKIIATATELETYEEGCLSFPEYFADIERPAWVDVRYLDSRNEIQTLRAEGMLSTCIQHEIDHLDGILFVDHISALRRGMILRKLQKAKRQKAKQAAA